MPQFWHTGTGLIREVLTHRVFQGFLMKLVGELYVDLPVCNATRLPFIAL